MKLSSDLRPTKWLRCARPNPQAAIKLVCFAHAGGSASSYAQWHRAVPADVEVWAVQLPGRENRLSEAPYTHLATLVDNLLAPLAPLLEQPCVFFGHSLGALLAFELARQLRQRGLPQPQGLVVSGHRAPQLPSNTEKIHHLPDDEFIRKVVAYEGIPAELLSEAEFRDIWLPALRADFTASETHLHQDAPPLSCPLVALGGVQDAKMSRSDLQAWRVQTNGVFRAQLLPGGHFFLHQHRERFMQTLWHELNLMMVAHA